MIEPLEPGRRVSDPRPPRRDTVAGALAVGVGRPVVVEAFDPGAGF